MEPSSSGFEIRWFLNIRICNPIIHSISYLYIHFTTSTIFFSKACWIRAIVLQVKLWPNYFYSFLGNNALNIRKVSLLGFLNSHGSN
jgi:hypothetical protein